MTTLDGPRDGDTFDSSQDESRLNIQMRRTWAVLSDHQWHTSAELEERVGDSWASVGARLRDLRKPKFGGHSIEKRRIPGANGLWEYRLLPTPPSGAPVLPPKLQAKLAQYKAAQRQ